MAIHFTHKGKVHFTLTIEKNFNLLGHAQMEEIFIGSQCGGHGVCGKDRIQIPKEAWHAFSPPTPDEKSHLTKGELGKGIRLACQVFPNQNDIEVSIEILSPAFLRLNE